MEKIVKVDPLIWVVVLATALSSFFSLIGFSLRSLRRAQLEDILPASRRSRYLDILDRRLNSLRLTVSLCRSLGNMVLVVALVYLLGAHRGGWATAAYAIATAGAIIAIFCVAIPHAWAGYAGEKIIARTLGMVVAVWYAMYPITVIMEAFDMPVRRLSGVSDEQSENNESAKQEILQAAEEGQAEGAVKAEEVEMIESVIEFGQTEAGEIMTPRTDVFAISADLPWEQAARLIYESGHSRVPVYSDDLDNIIGILYAKDLLQLATSQTPATLRDVMRKPFFVPETKTLDDLLREFKGRKVHMAVVLDEYGGTSGIVTIEDVLEEIVGEIADEYDETAPAEIRQLGETVAEVDGRMRIVDLNSAMDLEIPQDEGYDTVAGLVFSELGYIPEAGEQVEAFGAKFTVLSADERKITRLKVEVIEPQRPAEQ